MQEMKQVKWLVEIRVKGWVALPVGESRTIHYEEVFAVDEYEARHTAYDTFVERMKYEPKIKKMMERFNLCHLEICAPDAVQL